MGDTGPRRLCGDLVNALFDAPLAGDRGAGRSGALAWAQGEVNGRTCTVAAVVPEAATAPLCLAGLERLQCLIHAAQQEARPLVLCVEQMRLAQDAPASCMGALRRVMAAAMRAQEHGVLMLMLAGAGGDLASTVLTWLGGHRIDIPAGADSAACRIGRLREQVAVFLGTDATLPPLAQRHRSLLHRLQRAGIELPRTVRPNDALPALATQFDEGFETLIGPGILRGVRVREGREVTLTGLIGGAPMDPVAAWMLAESIVTSIKARPERPLVLVLDSAGDADATVDESALLSEYLAHLAQTVAWARSQAVAINVWTFGGAGVASFLACTAAATRVVAFPEAQSEFGSRPPAIGAQGAVAAVSSRSAWALPGLVDEAIDEGHLPGRVALASRAAA